MYTIITEPGPFEGELSIVPRMWDVVVRSANTIPHIICSDGNPLFFVRLDMLAGADGLPEHDEKLFGAALYRGNLNEHIYTVWFNTEEVFNQGWEFVSEVSRGDMSGLEKISLIVDRNMRKHATDFELDGALSAIQDPMPFIVGAPVSQKEQHFLFRYNSHGNSPAFLVKAKTFPEAEAKLFLRLTSNPVNSSARKSLETAECLSAAAKEIHEYLREEDIINVRYTTVE